MLTVHPTNLKSHHSTIDKSYSISFFATFLHTFNPTKQSPIRQPNENTLCHPQSATFLITFKSTDRATNYATNNAALVISILVSDRSAKYTTF